MTDAVVIDARGMRCPWPVLRLARAARGLPAGSTVRIFADDPAAPGEIAALALEMHWSLERIEAGPMPGWQIFLA